jgi:hypothetical protein
MLLNPAGAVGGPGTSRTGRIMHRCRNRDRNRDRNRFSYRVLATGTRLVCPRIELKSRSRVAQPSTATPETRLMNRNGPHGCSPSFTLTYPLTPTRDPDAAPDFTQHSTPTHSWTRKALALRAHGWVHSRLFIIGLRRRNHCFNREGVAPVRSRRLPVPIYKINRFRFSSRALTV